MVQSYRPDVFLVRIETKEDAYNIQNVFMRELAHIIITGLLADKRAVTLVDGFINVPIDSTVRSCCFCKTYESTLLQLK